MPQEAYGGLPGRGVFDAMGPLLEKTLQNWYVGTLDLEKAFDRADPALALKVLRHWGMDTKVVNLLQDVWGNQRRCLQYMGETLADGASLPQADSWSMLALTAMLIPAVRAIGAEHPGATQVVFADDRTFACPSASSLAQVTRSWELWAARLGLQENRQKAQFYHPQKQGRSQLMDTTPPQNGISDKIRVLGFNFAGLQSRKADPAQKQRLLQSKGKLARVRCLPGTLKRKVRLAQYAVIPKASWGWLFRRPTFGELRPFRLSPAHGHASCGESSSTCHHSRASMGH